MPELLKSFLSDLQSAEEIEEMLRFFDKTPNLADVLMEFMLETYPVFRNE